MIAEVLTSSAIFFEGVEWKMKDGEVKLYRGRSLMFYISE